MNQAGIVKWDNFFRILGRTIEDDNLLSNIDQLKKIKSAKRIENSVYVKKCLHIL